MWLNLYGVGIHHQDSISYQGPGGKKIVVYTREPQSMPEQSGLATEGDIHLDRAVR
jgi:hypothetical protein